MAKRYSGNVEVRMDYGGEGFYFATIRAPGWDARAILSTREVGFSKASRLSPGFLRSPEAYDQAALAFITYAEEEWGDLPVETDGKDHLIVRRGYQSPCPT